MRSFFKKFGAVFCVVIIATVAVFVTGCGFGSVVKKASKNLNTYAIDASFDESSNTLTGKQKVLYKNTTGATLDNICFHIFAKAFREGAKIRPWTSLTEARCFPDGVNFGDMTVTLAQVSGQETTFVFDGEDENILKIELSEPLEKGEVAEVNIEWVTKIANCEHRLGVNKDCVNLSGFFPRACEFEDGEFDKTPYYATGDPFNFGVANFNVNLTLPAEYVVASSGTVKTINKNGGRNTYVISGLALRDFAAVCGKNLIKISEKVGNTTVNYFCDKNKENPQNDLKLAARAVNFYNATFFEYPYRELNIVESPFMQGGMEFSNLCLISSNVNDATEHNKVVAHEVAHQWWYGVCGNNQIKDAWFDEGLAEISTFMFFDKYREYGPTYSSSIQDAQTGYNLFLEVFESIEIPVKKQMNLSVNEYSNEYEYTYMVYVKGALMFDEIKSSVGDKAFVRALKNLYKKHKFGKITKDMVADSFSGSARKRVNEILNKYINGEV